MYLLSKILFSDYLFLVPLFGISFIAAWEDFKYGKIRNKWIKIGFFWGLAAFALFLIWNTFFWLMEYFKIGPHSALILKPSYLGEVALNTGIAFGVGFLMWHWNVWSAGDAKLFALFSFLLPLKFYSKSYLSYFPSFALLLNIFTIALIVFLITLVWTFFHWIFTRKKITLNEKEKATRQKELKQKTLSIVKEIFGILVIFFVIVSFFGILLRSPVGENLSDFVTVKLGLEKWTVFIIFLGAFLLLMRFLQKVRIVFYVLAVILLGLLFYKWIYFGQSPSVGIKPMLGITSIIVFGGFSFRKMFDWYLKKKEIRKVKIEELKPGMRLTEETLNKLKGKDRKLFKKSVGRIYPDGLTKKQIPLLKEFIRGKKIQLEVYQPSPFAILMLVGLIITIVLRGAIIQPLLK